MKLRATILKDVRILLRDRMGLVMMFVMPIILVVIVTLIQSNTFDLIDKKALPLVICNRDTGQFSKDFVHAVDKLGMFKLDELPASTDTVTIIQHMRQKDAPISVVIPPIFSAQIAEKAKNLSGKALNSFGLEGDTVAARLAALNSLTLYYKPEVEQSFKISAQSALGSALQMVQSRQVLRELYHAINEKPLPDSTEKEMLDQKINMSTIAITKSNAAPVPNATQHNVPAWTLFAMFFVVMSLAGSIVREKINGSFIRLKTLPTSFGVALLSKQLTYLVVTLLQAVVIFSIGMWIFPHIGLPALNMPPDMFALLLVTFLCGWCAVSYAICIGVFAKTQEQANGFGAVSIVILAVIGGLMIPSFAMPDSFKAWAQFSPLHWCLRLYYGLFLEGGKLTDVLTNILPLLLIIAVLQLTTFIGLKTKSLI
ncbi:MAG: ABC transporter permease [Filimonas sp.]|nr:ABC transporter permease [Filimonas sp.]